ncbi:MAG: Mg chelatase, subunit ChlI [Firmicutes bacterium]|nr:Mg chelatase, subunit ChlI [Bacillota bacterium]
MHGCPCGFLGASTRECTCSVDDIRRYIKKNSGPLLERIDITVSVPRLEYSKIIALVPMRAQPFVLQQVEEARVCQL